MQQPTHKKIIMFFMTLFYHEPAPGFQGHPSAAEAWDIGRQPLSQKGKSQIHHLLPAIKFAPKVT